MGGPWLVNFSSKAPGRARGWPGKKYGNPDLFTPSVKSVLASFGLGKPESNPLGYLSEFWLVKATDTAATEKYKA